MFFGSTRNPDNDSYGLMSVVEVFVWSPESGPGLPQIWDQIEETRPRGGLPGNLAVSLKAAL